jgi:hypothetical protein
MENAIDTPERVTGKRGKKTTFEALGIPVGSELVFKNDSGIKCVTVDAVNMVEKDEQKWSISALASAINHYPSSGYGYFTFNGKLLSKLKAELDPAPQSEPVVTGSAESPPPEAKVGVKAEEAVGPKTHWTPDIPAPSGGDEDPFNI